LKKNPSQLRQHQTFKERSKQIIFTTAHIPSGRRFKSQTVSLQDVAIRTTPSRHDSYDDA